MNKLYAASGLITVVLLSIVFGLAAEPARQQEVLLWSDACPGSHVEIENDIVYCYGVQTETPTPVSTETPTPTPTATETPTPSPTPIIGAFYDPLTGNPNQPEPFESSIWDVTVHSRDNLYSLDPMMADHSGTCEGPPALHEINEYEEAVYQCRDHVMTAIRADDYGVIYLTASTLVDFSQEAVISWRMSTKRTSMERDWVDVWLCPFEDCLQLPLQNFLPDLQGVPRNAILIRLQGTRNAFEVFVIRDFISTSVAKGYVGYEAVLVPDRLRRDLFEIVLSPTHIKVWMPEYGLVFANRDIAPLTWTTGVVQFGHHSYNPYKDGGLGPNSWHWDDFKIEPAVPMSIIADTRRYYRPGESEVVLSSPTLPGSYLRFAGIGTNLQFSVDGGTTWINAQRQPSGYTDSGHFASYQTPIPAGVSQILLRGGDWWGGAWHIRDLSVFVVPQGD